MAGRPLEEDTEEEAASGGLSGKHIAIIIAGLVLVAGIGVGAYLMLGKGAEGESTAASSTKASSTKTASSASPADPAAPVYYDLPDFLVNLNTGGKQASFLKMKVTLEIQGDKAAENLKLIEPKVVDGLNMYLRELRASDLTGSAGMHRLKEELLLRVNKLAQPKVKVNDILFKEMIVQ
ncbi:MAG: flagellar basal body-associated FliL family protein [Alphaproteobacteria bacterium]|nr:flagellar basal body-associated FliL family protein [Alphaproteobacteria bacterium]